MAHSPSMIIIPARATFSVVCPDRNADEHKMNHERVVARTRERVGGGEKPK